CRKIQRRRGLQATRGEDVDELAGAIRADQEAVDLGEPKRELEAGFDGRAADAPAGRHEPSELRGDRAKPLWQPLRLHQEHALEKYRPGVDLDAATLQPRQMTGAQQA